MIAVYEGIRITKHSIDTLPLWALRFILTNEPFHLEKQYNLAELTHDELVSLAIQYLF